MTDSVEAWADDVHATARARASAREELESVEAQMAKRSLKKFIQVAWKILEPQTPLVWNWHLDVLCKELEKISRGERDRFIINVPPGTMKSLIVSVFWNAWEWTWAPHTRWLSASYGDRVAERDNMKVRDIVQSPWYQRQFGLKLRQDQTAKQKFINAEGGWRICTTTHGAGTGEHPDRLVIDDPHKAEDATSPLKLEATCDWYSRTVSTRGVTRGTAVVLIMQRLATKDLTDYLLDLGDWRHIMFPMEYEPDRAHYLDPREKKGELLWPALFPKAKVERLKRELGPYGAAGQLQQRPAPEGGGLFKEAWFKLVDPGAVPPDEEMMIVRFWDCAATEDEGDYTAGVKMGYHYETGLFYWLDLEHGQWSPRKVNRTLKKCAELDDIQCSIREEQEPGSAGKAVIKRRAVELARYDYAGEPSTTKKEVKARPFRAAAENGNIRMVQAPWNRTALDELIVFDRGNNDDIVDAASGAYNFLATETEVQTAELKW